MTLITLMTLMTTVPFYSRYIGHNGSPMPRWNAQLVAHLLVIVTPLYIRSRYASLVRVQWEAQTRGG
jgi:hypothetical protein